MKKNTEFGTGGWTAERMGDLTAKTFVITGTTSGTGYEATRILLSKGATVVMLNRNLQKSNAAEKAFKEEFGQDTNVSSIQMDLAVQASVREAAQKLLDEATPVDALICNGAIAQVPNQVLTVDGHESQLGVNHYGHFTLQAMLFPLVEKAKGRIVTVGSMGYNLGLKRIKFEDLNWNRNYTGNDAYSQSKLAQIMTVYELQDRLKEVGNPNVSAYACHPGASRTSLIKTSGGWLTRLIWQLMKWSPLVQSAEKGSYPELMCATAPDLDQRGFYGPTGRNYWTGPVGACRLEGHALDKQAAVKLWSITEEQTGQRFNL